MEYQTLFDLEEMNKYMNSKPTEHNMSPNNDLENKTLFQNTINSISIDTEGYVTPFTTIAKYPYKKYVRLSSVINPVDNELFFNFFKLIINLIKAVKSKKYSSKYKILKQLINK